MARWVRRSCLCSGSRAADMRGVRCRIRERLRERRGICGRMGRGQFRQERVARADSRLEQGCPVEAAPIAGATADYNFLQGTGTVLTDNSGNGNNGTLGAGALAPTWTSNGLELHRDSSRLPSGFVEWIEHLHLWGLSAADDHSCTGERFPMLLGSSVAGSGLNLLYDYATDVRGSGVGYLYPRAYDLRMAGCSVTDSKNLVVGLPCADLHSWDASGVQSDHIYIDGVASYVWRPGTSSRRGSDVGQPVSGLE